jgi:hypothetical protein
MTTTELLAVARGWLNDENASVYKWTTADLVNYYNYVLDEIARETDYFTDPSTPICTSIALLAGVGDYVFDATVLEIIKARVAGENFPLVKTRKRLEDDYYIHDWRLDASVSGIDISLTASSIDSVTEDFLAYGFKNSEYVDIAGSLTTANNKTVLIDTVTAHTLALNSAYSLTPRVAGDRIVLKQMVTGTPRQYMTDYRTGYVTICPAPIRAGSLLMDVTRLQSTLLTVATIGSYTIPIHYQYHLQLLDGILSKAYVKSGPSTFNVDKASLHNKLFMVLKDRIKRDMEKSSGIQRTLRPCQGSI